MKFVPSNPVVFVLVIIAFFATGMLFGKMFCKKKTEKFDSCGRAQLVAQMQVGLPVCPPKEDRLQSAT